MAGATEAVYQVKVTTETSALDKVAKDVDALKNAQSIPIKADVAIASQSIESIKQQTKDLAQSAIIPISADSTQATQALGSVREEVTATGKGANIPVKVNTGEAESALKKLTSDAESSFGKIKEQGKSILSGVGAGFLAGGAAMGAGQALDAAKEDLKAQEDLKIALRNTGVAGDALNKSFDESEKQAHTLADAYAQPIDKMRQLETDVANFGGITGAQKDKVLQIGIAMQQFGLSARALRGIIAGAADPESQAALVALKSKIGGLGTAFETAKTPGEKLNAIYARMQPTLEGMKDAADGPIGSMEKMDETGKQLEIGFGSLIFGVLTPFLPIVSGIGDVINGVVIPALTGVTGFIDKNKVAVGVLAVGVGALAIAMNAATIGTTAFSIAEKAQAIATGVVTGAQALLNAVMAANPIVLIVAAIAALAAGAIYLYDHVKPVHDAFDLVWTVLKGLGAFIGAFVSTEVAALAKAFQGVGSVIDGIVHMNFNEVKQGVGQVTDAIGTGMSGAKAGVKAFNTSLEGTADAAAKAGAAGKQAGDDAAGGGDAAAESWNQAKSAYTDYANAAKSGVSDEEAYINAMKLRLRLGGQMDNGKFVKDSEDTRAEIQKNIAAATTYGQEWNKINVQMQADSKATKESVQGDPKKHKAKAAAKVDVKGVDPFKQAKEQADLAAQQLKEQIDYDNALAGTKITAEQQLAIDEKRLHVLDQQLGQYGLISQAAKDTAERSATISVLQDTSAVSIAAQEEADKQKKIAQELQDAQIAIMQDGAAKEIATLQTKFDRENQALIDAKTNGTATQDQSALLMDREVALQEAIAATKQKYAKKDAGIEIDISKQTHDAVLALETDLFDQKQKMTAAEIALQEDKFNKDQKDLAKSLQRGEIDYKTYNDSLKKLAQDRANFEKKVEGEKFAAITKLYTDTQQNLLKKGEDWLAGRITQIVGEQTAFIGADAAKTAAHLAGSALRIGQDAIEGVASLAVAGANMVAALASEIWEAVTSLGPIAGPAVGLAAAGAIYGGYVGLKHTLGFEYGGMAMVGEAGKPELISPAKEFASYSTSLVVGTVKEVRRQLQQMNVQRGGGLGRTAVDVNGSLKVRGRDLDYSLVRNTVTKRSEQMIPQPLPIQ